MWQYNGTHYRQLCTPHAYNSARVLYRNTNDWHIRRWNCALLTNGCKWKSIRSKLTQNLKFFWNGCDLLDRSQRVTCWRPAYRCQQQHYNGRLPVVRPLAATGIRQHCCTTSPCCWRRCLRSFWRHSDDDLIQQHDKWHVWKRTNSKNRIFRSGILATTCQWSEPELMNNP